MNKKFYRVSNTNTNQGLWYDMQGNFTGLINNKFNFCLNHDLPMPYDKEIIGWLSATDELDSLWFWFTKEDISKLEEHGFFIHVYEASKYRFHNNHWVICQETSVLLEKVMLKDLFGEDYQNNGWDIDFRVNYFVLGIYFSNIYI